jgi:CDGSH-type Zn-finger protein
MEAPKDARILVTEDGPYVVTGAVPLVRAEIVTNEAGESVEWRETECSDAGARYSLCRCGKSKMKPFCDASHLDGFDGTETAGHGTYLEESVPITGPGIVLHDARKFCAEARFCDRAGGLWNLVSECADPKIRALAEHMAMLCPSGRYVACDAETNEPAEFEWEPSIVLVEDPQLGVSGPLWVRGGIRIFDAEGQPYEVRNRVTLCRCGESKDKPFCDGSHITAKFRDVE